MHIHVLINGVDQNSRRFRRTIESNFKILFLMKNSLRNPNQSLLPKVEKRKKRTRRIKTSSRLLLKKKSHRLKLFNRIRIKMERNRRRKKRGRTKTKIKISLSKMLQMNQKLKLSMNLKLKLKM
jgi:hypothetical protein